MNINNTIRYLIVVLLSLVINFAVLPIAYSQEVHADVQSTSNQRIWNLKSVDINTLISAVAKETNINFVVSPTVTGKVTFISSHPLTRRELYQAFLALLNVNGFAAVKDGPITKIITNEFVKEQNSQLMGDHSSLTKNEIAVTTIRVKYVPAADLVSSLRQLVFHYGYIEVYKPTNDIIISDYVSNIERILALIGRLDKPFVSNTEIIHLRYAQPADLVNVISGLLQKNSSSSNLSLAADERSGDILLHGATPEQRLQVRTLISHLDAPINKKNITTEVIYLKYLRAQRVAVILKSLIANLMQQKKDGTNQKNDEFSTIGTQASSSSPAEAGASPSGAPPSENNLSLNLSSLPGANTNSSISAPSSATSIQSSGSSSDLPDLVQRQANSGSEGPFVQWEESTNAVVVSAPEDIMIKLKSVIARLDIRRPQVLIEAVIAEVEADRAREMGIELNAGGTVQLLTRFPTTLPLSGIGADNDIAISNPPTPDMPGSGLSLSYFKGNKLRLLVRALENDSRSNILSTPNILTLDNEPAQIKVGEKISFSIGQIQNNPTGGNPFNFFNQQDVGLILSINPQITPDGSIKLVIQQELSNVLPGQVSAGSNPNLSERFIHTTVMAKNGDILVLGGLIQNEWQDIVTKVPVLGDIPWVGVFFRNHEQQLTKQNLMVFLRPTILYDESETLHIVGSKYENLRQQQLATEKEITAQNEMTTPVLPTWNRKVVIPPPFNAN